MSIGSVLERARERTSKLVDHLLVLFPIHETNRHLLYSDHLVGQIPRSYAAHAYNSLQQSSALFELSRLAAIWDRPQRDRESIPTIVDLLSKPGVLEHLGSHALYAPAKPNTISRMKGMRSNGSAGQRSERAVSWHQTVSKRCITFATTTSLTILCNRSMKKVALGVLHSNTA